MLNMTRAEKIKQLNELGFKTKIENGIIFVYIENYESDSKERQTIREVFKGYEHSYGVRPLERYEEDNGKETKEEK